MALAVVVPEPIAPGVMVTDVLRATSTPSSYSTPVVPDWV
ncbi:hypothetical protein QFZ56_007181 [Streptomyces achromogenes]|uniref:Uncharacterized protein n=1 Tax=Streptomyces achromogenes TaxID=67255 RepID=A0ABU0QC27_STRAH|nr:hypothetical protein [Streptomyces achromogenes]